MKIASTNTREDQRQKEKNGGREQNRNLWIALLQGTFIRISFAFADPTTVLSAFVLKLTQSTTLVGLTGSIMAAGWMWPQLLISNLLEHRPRKMPFYILGMSMRTGAWLAIVLCTLLIGSRNNSLLALSFICFYFIGASSMGVSTIPFMDILSKSIEPQKRARFFSLRNFVGGIFTGIIGFFVQYVLSDKSGLAFPNDYALLFGCAFIAVGMALIVFLNIREPIHQVQTARRSLWQHLKQGPHFLRTDRNYRLFLLFRICGDITWMCGPFYVPHALQRLALPDSIVGLFLTITAFSTVISSVLWGYMGERYGVRWILICSSALVCTAPFVASIVRYVPAIWQMPCYFLIFALNGAIRSGTMVGYMTYMINIAPPLNRPTYLGFMNTILVPLSFVAVLAGALVSGIHYEGIFFTIDLPGIDYEGIFAICVGMGLLAFFMATRLEDVFHDEGIQSNTDS